jgi:hypothetical protein
VQRHLYVKAVLDHYRRTPGTLGHARPEDRRLAGILYDRGVSVEQVDAALLLAVVRRTFRPSDAAPLNPVRSLHYILPLLDEIRLNPPDPGYLRYLQSKLDRQARLT